MSFWTLEATICISIDDELLWKVPITIAFPMTEDPLITKPEIWLSEKEVDFKPQGRPYIINVFEAGYYRVNYDLKNWNELTAILNSDDYFVINKLNRAQLLDDALNLARAEKLQYNLVLGMLKYLSKEDNYIPWEAALNGVAYLYARFQWSQDEKRLTTFLTRLFANRYKTLGFKPKPESDNHLDILGRSSISRWMCKLNYEDCLAKSMAFYENWIMEKDNTIPADMKDVVYSTAIRMGNSTHWDFMYQKFVDGVEIDSERQKFIESMGASEDPVIIEKYLNMTINASSGIRRQDCSTIFKIVSSGKTGRYVAMNWMDGYFEEISEAFGDGKGFARYGTYILEGFASTSNDLEDIYYINNIVQNHQEDFQGEMTRISDLLQVARLNVAWKEDNYAEVVEWLKKEQNEDGGNGSNAVTQSLITLVALLSLSLLM